MSIDLAKKIVNDEMVLHHLISYSLGEDIEISQFQRMRNQIAKRIHNTMGTCLELLSFEDIQNEKITKIIVDSIVPGKDLGFELKVSKWRIVGNNIICQKICVTNIYLECENISWDLNTY